MTTTTKPIEETDDERVASEAAFLETLDGVDVDDEVAAAIRARAAEMEAARVAAGDDDDDDDG